MTDETLTGWRTRALRAWGWALAHPEVAVPAGCFLLGVVIGAVLL